MTGRWVCPDRQVLVALPGVEGDTKVKKVEVVQAGQGKRKVWAMIAAFPLQSLCVQDAWVGIQVV